MSNSIALRAWITALSRRPLGLALAMALGLLAGGFGSAAVGFALSSSSIADTAHDPVTPAVIPTWVFWVVWLVVYPTLGIATSIVWTHRVSEMATGALLLLVVNAAITYAFVPATVLADDIRVTATLDLVGLVAAVCLGVSYRQVSRSALLWALPYLVWMPVTASLKWLLVVQTWH